MTCLVPKDQLISHHNLNKKKRKENVSMAFSKCKHNITVKAIYYTALLKSFLRCWKVDLNFVRHI